MDIKSKYKHRNEERRQAMKLYCEEKYNQALEILEPCREMSYHMYAQEKNIVLFKIDYILDTMLLIKILRKLE